MCSVNLIILFHLELPIIASSAYIFLGFLSNYILQIQFSLTCETMVWEDLFKKFYKHFHLTHKFTMSRGSQRMLRSFSISWELVRNINPQAPPQNLPTQKLWGWEFINLGFTKTFHGFRSRLNFVIHQLNREISLHPAVKANIYSYEIFAYQLNVE